MLMTVLVLSGSILGASTIAGYLMLLKIRHSSALTNSTQAVFAADTGIEFEFYKLFKNPDYPAPIMTNGTAFTSSNSLVGSFTVIKALGVANNIARAFDTTIILP